MTDESIKKLLEKYIGRKKFFFYYDDHVIVIQKKKKKEKNRSFLGPMYIKFPKLRTRNSYQFAHELK